jgi:ferredoxin
MDHEINKIAAELLQQGEVQLIIGYGEGSHGRVRPFFAHTGEEAAGLLFDQRCTQNLAVYLYKKEIVKKGKPAVIANIPTLRGIIRLAAENQINDGDLIAIAVNAEGKTEILRQFAGIENYLAAASPQLDEQDQALLNQLNAMNADERWHFWQNEMEHCIRCYACRQACPLCYCTQCTVEVNQPQWIPVEASQLGNLEWHIMRAMHLSGRCIECGQCGEACPANIPIHLLPIRLAEEVKDLYGSVTGMKQVESCEMSTFKPDDKENFIG